MFTSIIPQRKGRFTIKGSRETLADHLRKAGALIGTLDLDVYSFRMVRRIGRWGVYVITGTIKNTGEEHLIEYHIRPYYFTQWLWAIAIPGNFLFLLYSDLDIAQMTGLSLVSPWARYTSYFTFILLALIAFSWLVLSDMAITEKRLTDVPYEPSKEELSTDGLERNLNGK